MGLRAGISRWALLFIALLPICVPQTQPGDIATLAGGASEFGAPSIVPPTGHPGVGTPSSISALVADAVGGVYYAACAGNVVRYVRPDLLTSDLVAGACYPPLDAPLGDGGPATSARLRRVVSLALNASGLFIGESGRASLRFVAFGSGVISTVAAGAPWATPACLTAPSPPSPFAGALVVGSNGADRRAYAFFPGNSSFLTIAGNGNVPSAAT
jgi:hypothetical protein